MNKILCTEASWLAGLFEGEGSTGIYKNRTTVAVRFVIPQHTQSVDVLHRIKEIVGVGSVNGPYKTKTGSVCFYQCSKQSDVEKLIKLIYPYLLARRRAQCDKVLNYIQRKSQDGFQS